MKVKDVIAAIKAACPYPEFTEMKAPFSDKVMQIPTCDVLHFGDPEREVHKIASTFMVTVDVIKKAMAEGVDMIITHEGSNCGGNDKSFPVQLNEVTQEKQDLIVRSGIAIWRYHDGAHHCRPDIIYRGWMKEFDWEQYLVPGPNNHEYKIPETDLKSLAALVAEKLSMDGVRVVGDPDLKISRVGVLVGGGSQGLGNPHMPIEFMLEKKLDTLICGEISELLLVTFVQDAIALGRKMSLIIVGHDRTEEPGMKYFPEWLAPLVDGIPCTFIESGDPIYCMK